MRSLLIPLFMLLLLGCKYQKTDSAHKAILSFSETPSLTTVSGVIDSLEKEIGDKYVRILDFFPGTEYPEILASQKIDSSGIYQLEFLTNCQRTYFFQFGDRTIPILPKPGTHLRLNFSADYFLRLTNPENCVRVGGEGSALHSQLYHYIPEFKHWWSRRPYPGEVRLMGAEDYKNYWLNIHKEGKKIIDTISNQTPVFQQYIHQQLDCAVLGALYDYNSKYFRAEKDTLVLDDQYFDFELQFDFSQINQLWNHDLFDMVDKKRRAILTNHYRSKGLSITTTRIALHKELKIIREKINPNFQPYAVAQQLRQAIHQSQIDSAKSHLYLLDEALPGKYLKQQLEKEILAIRSYNKKPSVPSIHFFDKKTDSDIIHSIINRHPDTLLCLIRWDHSSLSTIEALSETVQITKDKPVKFIFFAENMTTYHWHHWVSNYQLLGDHYSINPQVAQQINTIMGNRSNFKSVIITPNKQLIRDTYRSSPFSIQWMIKQLLETEGDYFRRDRYEIINLQ